ncbi:MAG: DNA mismatch repair endonuclease MutL [Clostridia bacterium]|nr:DNA mismatch repair endonuclease MutL [Clostridia bacterium]
MEEYRPIARLSDEVIGMIAAGEVVENPASAVKEMIENSLDAGATSVTIEIRDGGISYMRVSDNGRGIRKKDIRMAFERHATSKIRDEKDLYDLHTLGFRGEALASIAAVSRVTLTTSGGEETGIRVINEGGVFKEISDAASPKGTTIVVRDLFYNTPVRLKFLKKPATEAAKVSEVVARFILGRPDRSFRFINNGKQVYASSGNGDLKNAVFSIYGRDTANSVVPVHAEGAVSISGYVGIGDEARTSRSRQTFIVNGRNIRSPLLSQALETGCRERVTIGHYPICVLLLDMPGNMVDVNVHPNKLEVRFSDEHAIFEKVRTAVLSAFSPDPIDNAPRITLDEGREPVPAAKAALRIIDTSTEEGALQAQKAVEEAVIQTEQQRMEEPPAAVQPASGDAEAIDAAEAGRRIFSSGMPAGPERETAPLRERPSVLYTAQPQELFAARRPEEDGGRKQEPEAPRMEPEVPRPEAPAPAEAPLQKGYRGYSVVGVLFDTYIILQNDRQMLMVDQHAAHERVLYERLMRQVDLGLGSQPLLVPQIVHVTPQDKAKIEDYAQEIRDAGYDFEAFGEDAYQIRAVPCVLGEPEGKGAFLDLVESLAELRVLATRQKRRDAILQMACKKAIKGGDRIAMEEIVTLLNDIMDQDTPPTCPHGRPLVVVLTRSEIEKRFKRINH